MNLLKITKAMKSLDQQHNLVNNRFSTQVKTSYVYRDCLVEDEEEDRKIYGHTHTDTILKYKKRVNAEPNLEIPCFQPQPTKVRKQVNVMKKSQPAINSKNRKNRVLQSYTTHESPVLTVKKKELQFETSPLNVEVQIRKQCAFEYNVEARKKCEKKYQKYFNRSFQENIQITNDLIQTDLKRNAIQTPKSHQIHRKQLASQHYQKNIQQMGPNKENNQGLQSCLIQINDNSQALQKLNQLLFENFAPNLLGKLRSSAKNILDYFRNLQKMGQTQQWSYYIIGMSNFALYQINKKQPNYKWIEKLLENQRLLHFYIVKSKQDSSFELVYQEFIISKQLSLRPLEWPREIFRYFMKRFMMLSQGSISKQLVQWQEKTMFEERRSLPTIFYRFIYEMKLKPCIFIDHKLSQNVMWLHMVLQQGLSRFETRRLTWERLKGLKLGMKNHQNDNKQQIYFYICFFLFQVQINIGQLQQLKVFFHQPQIIFQQRIVFKYLKQRMKNKINDLEERLSKSVLEQQLLKSENLMLSKELQRLKRVNQKNNEYMHRGKPQSELQKKRQKILSKHEKNMRALNQKALNCKETIQKLRQLIEVGGVEQNKRKQQIKGKQNSIYHEVKCQDCSTVMLPCEYFMHLRNRECPKK